MKDVFIVKIKPDAFLKHREKDFKSVGFLRALYGSAVQSDFYEDIKSDT